MFFASCQSALKEKGHKHRRQKKPASSFPLALSIGGLTNPRSNVLQNYAMVTSVSVRYIDYWPVHKEIYFLPLYISLLTSLNCKASPTKGWTNCHRQLEARSRIAGKRSRQQERCIIKYAFQWSLVIFINQQSMHPLINVWYIL